MLIMKNFSSDDSSSSDIKWKQLRRLKYSPLLIKGSMRTLPEKYDEIQPWKQTTRNSISYADCAHNIGDDADSGRVFECWILSKTQHKNWLSVDSLPPYCLLQIQSTHDSMSFGDMLCYVFFAPLPVPNLKSIVTNKKNKREPIRRDERRKEEEFHINRPELASNRRLFICFTSSACCLPRYAAACLGWRRAKSRARLRALKCTK